MDCTDLLLSFRSFLDAALPHLDGAGIDAGGDEWDDFLEATFDVLVAYPIGQASGVKLAPGYYDSWPARGHETEILVELAGSPGEILVGEHAARASLESADAQRWYRSSEPPRSQTFAFRKFGHPFLDDGTKEALGYVMAHAPEQGDESAKEICVPVAMCRFVVPSS